MGMVANAKFVTEVVVKELPEDTGTDRSLLAF
jgi:hypothetical protein